MNLTELSKEIHTNAVNKGFWESENIPEKLMLVVTELAEAVEAHRSGYYTDKKHFNLAKVNQKSAPVKFKGIFESKIKDRYEDELADAIIRILDLCAKSEIDIDTHVFMKMQFNAGRPHKHGKKY